MLNLIKKEKGFTLIELMIVVAIIGILAAIAIPQFASYRIKAFNSAAQTDLRNMMTSEEATYADTQNYATSTSGTGPGAITGLTGAKASNNVSYNVTSLTSGASYAIYTKHSKGDSTYGGDSTGTMRVDSAGPAPSTLAVLVASGWGVAL